MRGSLLSLVLATIFLNQVTSNPTPSPFLGSKKLKQLFSPKEKTQEPVVTWPAPEPNAAYGRGRVTPVPDLTAEQAVKASRRFEKDFEASKKTMGRVAELRRMQLHEAEKLVISGHTPNTYPHSHSYYLATFGGTAKDYKDHEGKNINRRYKKHTEALLKEQKKMEKIYNEANEHARYLTSSASPQIAGQVNRHFKDAKAAYEWTQTISHPHRTISQWEGMNGITSRNKNAVYNQIAAEQRRPLEVAHAYRKKGQPSSY